MINPLYLSPLLMVSVALLIRAELGAKKRQVYVFKPLSTMLVIAAGASALFNQAASQTYTVGILIGLVLSLGGDIALMFQDRRRAFLAGLGLFLLAHVAYTAVFISVGRFTLWDLPTSGVLLLLAAGFYRAIKPNLGSMQVPVIAYMAVITLMVSRAFSTIFSPELSSIQAWLAFLGGVLFYLSDLVLAAHRYWKPIPYNRFSLALYYSGQMLIALSASYIS